MIDRSRAVESRCRERRCRAEGEAGGSTCADESDCDPFTHENPPFLKERIGLSNKRLPRLKDRLCFGHEDLGSPQSQVRLHSLAMPEADELLAVAEVAAMLAQGNTADGMRGVTGQTVRGLSLITMSFHLVSELRRPQ